MVVDLDHMVVRIDENGRAGTCGVSESLEGREHVDIGRLDRDSNRLSGTRPRDGHRVTYLIGERSNAGIQWSVQHRPVQFRGCYISTAAPA
jgi:hypothetical protein